MINRRLVLFGSLIVLILCGSLCIAQSGRKIPKRESPPPAAPAEEAPAAPEPEKPKTAIAVSYDLFSVGQGDSIYYSSVAASCLERLKAARVKATSAGELNRKQASDLAKQADNTWVIWIQLGSDSLRPEYGAPDPRNAHVEFVLYSPSTGKTKTSGRVYLAQMSRTGNVGVGIPLPTGRAAADYLYHRAGEEVANRALASIGIAQPPSN